LFIQGGPGIGKSQVPRQVFREVAENKNLEFVQWDKTSKDMKDTMEHNPEKYFVFCDQRLSQMDSTDLRGIPNMNADKLEPMPPSWVVYFCNPKAQGVIFFDEINLAPPVVAGSAYQIILDRSMADMKLGDNVYLIGAGNRAEDKAFTFEMSLPLKDRFCEMELYPDAESWTEWAASNKINPHLIAFINWKESYLYRMSETGQDKATTPRGIERASILIGDSEITDPEVTMLTSISVGEAFSTEFQAYVKYFSKLDWNLIYREPITVKEFDVSQMFAVSGGLAEHFIKDNGKFEDVITVVDEMPAEFAVMALRIMRDSNRTAFKRKGMKSKKFSKEVAPKLGKFVI